MRRRKRGPGQSKRNAKGAGFSTGALFALMGTTIATIMEEIPRLREIAKPRSFNRDPLGERVWAAYNF
jgi:hypothetical protein